jgi:hypothetical protein
MTLKLGLNYPAERGAGFSGDTSHPDVHAIFAAPGDP